MKITVANKIRVEGVTRELADWCRDNLTLTNPDYIKKERMSLWCGNLPRQICLYELDGDSYALPFGVWGAEFYNLFGKGEGVEVIPAFKPLDSVERIDYQSKISLYDYQAEAVGKALKKGNGVVVMPCGAGKTQTALELIARLGLKTLWLTHTQDLLTQSLNRAKSVLDIEQASYGKITGGKVDIGYGITFATVQTMSKLDLAQYKDTWQAVVVDECHKAIGSPTKVMQFYKVLSNLNCRYKYGLTATPKRADGLERSMFALIGNVIHTVPREAVAGTTCPIRVDTIETGYTPDTDFVLAGDGTLNYASLVQDMVSNKERKNFVFNKLKSLDGSTLVLANRVEYLAELCAEYRRIGKRAICLSTLGNSKKAKKERREALVKLNAGELDCVFATYQLAKEGLDVPNLRYLVLATPEKDETTVTQAVGRVGRKADGKEYGTVIDFVDNFGMYRGWHKKRLGYYKKLEAQCL